MGWRRDVLKRVGAPATKQNLDFLATWQRWEGGHTNNKASFNWLNTTSNAPGATHSINSVGVKAFDSYENGVNATVQTLNNGRYGDIVGALRSGNPYKEKPVAGLSTWLSGKPNSEAGIAYAGRVLGGPVSGAVGASVKKGGQSYGGGGPSPQQRMSASSGEGLYQKALAGFMLGRAAARFQGQNPEGGLMQLAQLRQQYQEMGGVPDRGRSTADKAIGKAQGHRLSDVQDGNILIPKVGQGTHITDGLDWNQGKKTAVDIMAKAGTAVGAPEDGVVLKWDPQGAQGGGRMWFKGKSGRMYWLGHIDDSLPVGSQVRFGQAVARVSSDHAAPHLHFDYKL